MKGSCWVSIFVAAWAGASATADIATDIDYFGHDFRPPGPQTRVEKGERFEADLPFEGSSVQAMPKEYWHTLLFQDGRRLRGWLVEITKDEILWRRKDASELLRFARTDVRRVLLVPPPESGAYASSSGGPSWGHTFTLRLSGGNWLKGQVTSSNGELFEFDDSDEEEVVELLDPKNFPNSPNSSNSPKPRPHAIAIPRPHVEWLSFGRPDDPVVRLPICPMALEGWYSGNTPRVEARDGILAVQGAEWIGHDLAWRDRFEVAFEVPAETEEGLRIWLQPANGFQALRQSGSSPEGPPHFPGTVAFKFGKKALQYLAGGAPSGFNTLPLPAEAQAEDGPVSYRVLYDGIGRHVILLRNGRQLGDWALPGKDGRPGVEQTEKPRALCLASGRRDQTDLLRLRRLDVLPWDGVAPVEEASGKDWLSTGMQPPLAGHVDALRNARLVFAGKTLSFTTETYVKFPQATAPPIEAETLVSLGENGELSMADVRVSDDRVRGRTTFAPALDLPANRLYFIAFPSRESIPPAAGDRLIFRNGDELSGVCLAATTGALRWRLSTGQELDFQTDRIAGVRLANESKIGPAGTIELRSGERLRGVVAACDERTLRWTHPWLGELSVDRGQLWRLYLDIHRSPRDGTLDPKSWRSDTANVTKVLKSQHERERSQAWQALDGRLIVRMREAPGGELIQGPPCEIDGALDRFELRVDLASPSIERCTLNFGFSGPGECSASMVLSTEKMILETDDPKAPDGGGWRQVPILARNGEMVHEWRVRAFVNRPAGTIDFFLNGRFMGRAGESISNRLPGIGKSVAIQVRTLDRSELVLPQMAVVPWSGQLPLTGATGAVTALTNGDVALGAPAALVDSRWKLETDIGPIDLPFEQVQAVEFGGEMQTATTAAGRLRLVDGSTMLVDRFDWKPGGLTAHHALFGDIQLPATAVSELIYHPAPVRPTTVENSKRTAQTHNPQPALR